MACRLMHVRKTIRNSPNGVQGISKSAHGSLGNLQGVILINAQQKLEYSCAVTSNRSLRPTCFYSSLCPSPLIPCVSSNSRLRPYRANIKYRIRLSQLCLWHRYYTMAYGIDTMAIDLISPPDQHVSFPDLTSLHCIIDNTVLSMIAYSVQSRPQTQIMQRQFNSVSLTWCHMIFLVPRPKARERKDGVEHDIVRGFADYNDILAHSGRGGTNRRVHRQPGTPQIVSFEWCMVW